MVMRAFLITALAAALAATVSPWWLQLLCVLFALLWLRAWWRELRGRLRALRALQRAREAEVTAQARAREPRARAAAADEEKDPPAAEGVSDA